MPTNSEQRPDNDGRPLTPEGKAMALKAMKEHRGSEMEWMRAIYENCHPNGAHFVPHRNPRHVHLPNLLGFCLEMGIELRADGTAPDRIGRRCQAMAFAIENPSYMSLLEGGGFSEVLTWQQLHQAPYAAEMARLWCDHYRISVSTAKGPVSAIAGRPRVKISDFKAWAKSVEREVQGEPPRIPANPAAEPDFERDGPELIEEFTAFLEYRAAKNTTCQAPEVKMTGMNTQFKKWRHSTAELLSNPAFMRAFEEHKSEVRDMEFRMEDWQAALG